MLQQNTTYTHSNIIQSNVKYDLKEVYSASVNVYVYNVFNALPVSIFGVFLRTVNKVTLLYSFSNCNNSSEQ